MNWTFHANYSMSKLGIDSFTWRCYQQACCDEVAAVGEEWAAVGPGDFVLGLNGGACGENYNECYGAKNYLDAGCHTPPCPLYLRGGAEGNITAFDHH